MKYLLLMYAAKSVTAEFSKEDWEAETQTWLKFNEEMEASGALISTSGIPRGAGTTTVRVRDGETLTTDGPFAETHEQLGGYFIFECKNLEEAVRWAEKIPTAKYGSIEVRPLW